MKITLAYVSSLNGKITERDNPDVKAFSSREDGNHFVGLLKRSNVVIMDSTTCAAAGVQADKERLRIVCTRTPEKYADHVVAGHLEFTAERPTDIATRLAADVTNGQVLLAGGPRLAAAWINAQLVDDVYITIEPLLFAGREMLDSLYGTTQLQLESVKQLNQQGTLLAHYLINKS